MADSLRVVLAQINFLVGDIERNCQRVIELSHDAKERLKGDVILFPELTLTGYPPEDLLLRPELHIRVDNALEKIKSDIGGIHVILGFPEKRDSGIYNSAIHIMDGEIRAVYRKIHLPNYRVFDEKRYFRSGNDAVVTDINGIPVGLTICEDVWYPGPAAESKRGGASIIFNLNASPFHMKKAEKREKVIAQRVKETGLPLVYLNLVGGQDELVFDGGSFVMDQEENVVARLPFFSESLSPVDFLLEKNIPKPEASECSPLLREEESAYSALVLGVRDYVNKNGFPGAVLGLSGGIDSALTLAVAADALGGDRVEGFSMPSRYTADMSIEDAEREAENLGVKFSVIPMEGPFTAFLNSLEDEFRGLPVDTTEENIQARCRGVILMAISNKSGKIVLTTGNKSEMAVGYATLYGDMAGGFGVLKDVPKTLVYRLARYRNSISRVIPERVITRPPSAELAPDQKDTDSLPEYDILDRVLEMYVEMDLCVREIVKKGYEREMVEKVARMVDRNEYKRRQAPPGVRITERAFGRDRRYPITTGFSRNRKDPD
jgi:NAD+ synthase (glutamine-hydrolysing)